MFKRSPSDKSTSSEKLPPVQKPPIALIIKLAACPLALFGATVAFSLACREIADHFIIIFSPLATENIFRLIRLGVWTILFSVTLGVMAVLVRPFWIAIAACFLSATIYGLMVGPDNIAVWAIAGLGGLLMFTYVARVHGELKNQLKFSFRPLGRMKLLLSFLLALLIAVPMGIGYAKDAAERHYLIPTEIKAPITKMVVDQLKRSIEQQNVSALEKQFILTATTTKVQAVIDAAEKQIQPFAYALPYIFGAIAFSFFQALFWLIEIISLLILRLLIMVLRLTRFAYIAIEMRPVIYLTLQPIPTESPPRS